MVVSELLGALPIRDLQSQQDLRCRRVFCSLQTRQSILHNSYYAQHVVEQLFCPAAGCTASSAIQALLGGSSLSSSTSGM